MTCGNGVRISTRQCSSSNDNDCPGPSSRSEPCMNDVIILLLMNWLFAIFALRTDTEKSL